MQRIASWIGYPLFYLGCFAFFAYVSAPWDRLKSAVVSGFNSSAPFHMEMEKLTWAWRFPGVSARGIKLTGVSPGMDDKGKARPAPEYAMDGLFARVSLFPLLWGTQKLAFTVDGFGGDIDGTMKTSSDGRDVTIEFDDVDAAQMPYLTETLGLPVAGILKGTIDLKQPKDKLSLADGTIELTITDLVLGDGKTKIRDMIALPKVRGGTFTLKADVTEGTVKITELTMKGPDLEVVADGKIRLMDRPDMSLTELNLRFKFADGYKSKDETTKSIFGAPGSTVPGLFDLDPKMKRAKRDDGFYAWHITGPLAKLNFQAATADSATAKARRGTLPGFGSKPKAAAAADEAAPAE
jgi:type II secretion system protein N